MRFAKLSCGTIKYWNGHISINGRDIFTNDPRSLGWKIVDETQPEHREGYYVVYDGWAEDEIYIRQMYHYEPNPDPSEQPDIEQMDAQILYTATMTDTLLEE